MTHGTVLVLRCAVLQNRRRGPRRGEEADECGSAIEGTRFGAAGAGEAGRQLRAVPNRGERLVPVSYTHLTLPTNREV